MTSPQPISRRTALARGLSDADLRRLCRHGQWHRVRTGHYLETPPERMTPEQRHRVLVRATTATVSDAAVVSHISALVLHGLPVWRSRLDRAHLTRDRRTGARVGDRLVVHAAQLAPAELTTVDGTRCTSVARTLIDVARTEDFEQAVICGDAALFRGIATMAQVREHLRLSRHRPGYRRAAEVVAFLDGRSEDIGESRSRIALSRSGLPAPELQPRVLTPDHGFVARVDFLFAGLGVIGQCDAKPLSRNDIQEDPAAGRHYRAESHREHRLRALGWAIARWSWADLSEPDEPARRVQAAAATVADPPVGRWIAAPRL